MTHLGLDFSLEEPWLDLLGGGEEGGPSLEVVQASGEGWAGWCLGECLVPCLLALGGYYCATQGLCESIKRICGRYGIQTHFKGGKTIKNLLVSPKDKDPMLNQSGAIYRYQCNNLGCDDEYIGETSRTFGERCKEHLKAPSAIHHHSTLTGHTTNHNNFQIIGREGHNLARNIKESIYIRVNNPSLNNNIGKFNLSHIWDRVLLKTKGLTLK